MPTIPIFTALAYVLIHQGRVILIPSASTPPPPLTDILYKTLSLISTTARNFQHTDSDGRYSLFTNPYSGDMDIRESLLLLVSYLHLYCCFRIPHPGVQPFLCLYLYHNCHDASMSSLLSHHRHMYCPASLLSLYHFSAASGPILSYLCFFCPCYPAYLTLSPLLPSSSIPIILNLHILFVLL